MTQCLGYLVNKQELSSMKINLGILLADDSEETNGEVLFLTELEIMETLKLAENECEPQILAEEEENDSMLNEPYAIIWDEMPS